MNADFLPGFDVLDGQQHADGVVLFETEQPPAQKNEGSTGMPGNLSPVASVTGNPALYDARFGDFTARVERFARSLTLEQRAAIGDRPRFRNQPYLRRADESDPDDEIPGLPRDHRRTPGPNFP